jgi:ankyrin repeat protein
MHANQVASEETASRFAGETIRLVGSHRTIHRFRNKGDADYETILTCIKRLVNEAPMPYPEEEVTKCLQALFKAKYETHKNRNPDRTENTCQWPLKHPYFVQWQNHKSGFLCITADPGCGKSVLAKSLIDHDLKSADDRTTCYFFFKDDDEEQKSITNAISCILHQLFSQRKFLIRHGMKEFTNKGDKMTEDFPTLWNILLKATGDTRAGPTVCIIDALDECDASDRYILLGCLKQLYLHSSNQSKAPSNLRFIVTSRLHNDISGELNLLVHEQPTIHLSGERETKEIDHEIELVIKENVIELQKSRMLTDEHSRVIQEEISKRRREKPQDDIHETGHGTYLWVKFVFEELRRLPSVTNNHLLKTIRELPPSIEQMYDKILSHSLDSTLATKLLCVVLAAVRPLSLEEMRVALAIEDHHRSRGDLENDMDLETGFESRLKNLCGLFITVIDDRVYFIHQTAKEFLLAEVRDKNSSSWKNRIDMEQADLVMAETCMNYLLLLPSEKSNFTTGDNNGNNPDPFIVQYHYLSYAANSWVTHYCRSNARGSETHLSRAIMLCNVHQYYLWFWVYWWSNEYGAPKMIDPVMVATYFGLEGIVQHFINEKADLNAKYANDNRSTLMFAARRGYETVAKLLADANAELEAKDNDGWTALTWAATNGHHLVVKVLIEARVNLEAADFLGRTALIHAAISGHETVVELLINSNANLGHKDRSGMTALMHATDRGWKAIGKLLDIQDEPEEEQVSQSPSPFYFENFGDFVD